MSNSEKKTDKKAPPAEVMLKVRVLKSGTELNQARCCEGLVTHTPKATAEALQEQGLVKIIGA